LSAVPSLRALSLCAALALTTAGVAGCKDKSRQAAPAASGPSISTDTSASASSAMPVEPASAPAAQAAAPEFVNVAGMSAGAFVVDKARDDSRWLALLNEVPDSVGINANGDGWAGVIALAAPATIERVRFSRIADLSAAHHAQVQVSEQGADGPWRTVFDADLKTIPADQRNSQVVIDDIALDAPAKARWLRVSWRGGYEGVTSMQQFAALSRPTSGGDTSQRNVSGVYRMLNSFDSSSYVAIRQDGATIRGCHGHAEAKGSGASTRVEFRDVSGSFEGGVEPNGYLRFARGSGKDAWRGVMAFSPDGERTAVLEFPAAKGSKASMQDAVGGVGWKVASYQHNCPGLEDDQDALGKTLEADRRVTLYGVNFDVDAATLRPESKPALDGVVKTARAHPDWQLAIEGHTDNTGGSAHNDDLSKRRAQSVRQYLVDAGVAASRLSAQGYGATRPVAPNDNPAGRAQNRRVEVARQ
jgi:outer membrane protein OmpA-like peptidoglycan-associated protein